MVQLRIPRNPIVTIEVDSASLKSVLDLCATVPSQIGKKVLKKFTKEGAELVAIRARQILGGHVDTGRLKNAITARSVTSATKKYGDLFHKAVAGAKLGRKRTDTSGAYYAPFIEFGHEFVGRAGSHHGYFQPVYFLKKALENSARAITNNIINGATATLEKEAAKRRRKRKV